MWFNCPERAFRLAYWLRCRNGVPAPTEVVERRSGSFRLKLSTGRSTLSEQVLERLSEATEQMCVCEMMARCESKLVAISNLVAASSDGKQADALMPCIIFHETFEHFSNPLPKAIAHKQQQVSTGECTLVAAMETFILISCEHSI